MSDEGNTSGQTTDAPMEWTEFLAQVPPNQRRKLVNLTDNPPPPLRVQSPPIEIYCDNEKCQGVRFFDSSDGGRDLSSEWTRFFLAYTCRHCKRTVKLYAVLARTNNLAQGEAIKIGEWPPFGPHVPTKFFSLLGQDQETFRKGRNAESQGMGIGAFAYYRRVVENQKNRLIDEIIKVSKRLGAKPEAIAQLEAARKETQFHKAVTTVKDGIPDVLRIDGHNPLNLLHTALSDGLHDKSDEECLIRATSIRLVLAELAERIAQALSDHAELNQAVSKLLTIQSQKGAKATPARSESKPESNTPNA